MRVLVLSSVFPNGRDATFGVFVRERARALARLCPVEVVAPYPWFPGNHWLRAGRWSGIPALEHDASFAVHHPRFLSVPRYAKTLDGALYAASLAPVLARIRRTFPFDVIDAHFAYPDGMAAVCLGALFGCPVTVTLRGTIVPLSRFRLRRAQIRWTLRRAARVFSVSGFLRDVAVSLGVPASHIVVVPNGVDPRFTPGSRAEARRALGLPESRPIVVSIGALAPRKGHDRLLDALPAVRARVSDVLGVVVGGPSAEGDNAAALARRIDALGLGAHAQLAGARPHDEIVTWLNAADALCLASTNEGRANVVIEALACGLPVVASDIPPNAELIEPGVNGALVDLRTPAALADGLIQVLARSWDRTAIARAAAGRSWSHAAAEVCRELARVAQAPPGGVMSDLAPEEGR